MFNLDPSTSKNKAVQERRLGHFMYSVDFLTSTPSEVLRNVFMKVVPVKVKFDFPHQRFDVWAFSDEFEPVAEGESIPDYGATIKAVKRKKGFAYYVKFVKIESNPLASLFS